MCCPDEDNSATSNVCGSTVAIRSQATYVGVDIADIPDGSPQRDAFKRDFIAAVTAAMGVLNPVVTIHSIRAGSLVVEFTVTVGAEAEATALNLFDMMADSSTALVIELDGVPLTAPTIAQPTVDSPTEVTITLKTAANDRDVAAMSVVAWTMCMALILL